MDRITKSLIEELINIQGLESQEESKDFEKLVNYTVISNEYSRTFDLDFVTIGDGNDTGIDGLAIIVNGQLVEEKDEIDDLLEKNGTLEVTFIFIQAKTSSNFNSGDINTFLFGVKDFFKENPQLVRNDDVKKFAEISDYLYSKASKFKLNPDLKLYYVTTGTWVGDTNILAVISSGVQELTSNNLFNDVKFQIYGAKELTKEYRKTKEAIVTTILFSNRITLPSIEGISESYIGLLPFTEFRKIITDDNGKLLNVFEDNVRDFQGDTNEVNTLIGKTISSERTGLFSVLNNGVTIVASNISTTGDLFTIKDYQIVNGCQTSNVLFNYRDIEKMTLVNVPVKIIATSNEDIKNQITLATNNQTAIKKEQLAALTDFQRGLEQYYNSYDGDGRLYYERRSKQYNSDNSIIKSRIITIPIQIKSFSAMFLQNPHFVTSFFGQIVKRLNADSSQIFKPDHLYISYYTSALAFYRLEGLLRKKIIDPKYKKVKFHLLMLFKGLATKSPLPFFNSKQMDKYCQILIDILNDEEKTLYYFNLATLIIDKIDFNLDDKQHVKLSAKTQLMLDAIKTNNISDNVS
jgi:hypothetical protein